MKNKRDTENLDPNPSNYLLLDRFQKARVTELFEDDHLKKIVARA